MLSSHQLDAAFAALSDPTRRAILARLARGEASVKEVSDPFALSPPAITKHLKVLERAGLIVRGREAQRRPCALNAAPLKDLADWLAFYRRFWNDSFERLDAHLARIQNAPKKPSKRRKS
jgi:DNA-binding transcriptional ArsR family regulator